MFNRKNILGWINLALRLVLSFGLIFLVSKFIGNQSVGLWIVYITIIATINSIDGLLSQFFIREIISCTWSNDSVSRTCQYYNQQIFYVVIGFITYFVGYYALKMTGIYHVSVSVALALYMMARVHDSRFRAHTAADLVQKTEIRLNCLLMIIVACAMFLTKDIRLFILIHISSLILLLLLKLLLVKRNAGHQKYLSRSAYFVKQFRIDQEVLKTIIISFGSGLSVNLSLISMEAMTDEGVSTSFLFTYRVASLICEIISIPVIIRIPEITKLIASDNQISAQKSFMKNYKLSILLCLFIMLVVFSLQGVWNHAVPQNLNLVGRTVLISIFGGWLFERIATLLSQFFLSCKAYHIYKYYIAYAGFVSISVAASVVYGKDIIFSFSVMFINMILASFIVNRWRTSYGYQR